MKRIRFLVVALCTFPCFVFGQSEADNYSIYSKYLADFEARGRGIPMELVVKETLTYSLKYDSPDVDGIVSDCRKYLKGDKKVLAYEEPTFRRFTDTLVTDTVWISLLSELGKKIKSDFKIKNVFSTDLPVVVINEHTYSKYFKRFKTGKQIDRNWIRFDKKYPMPSALVELSDIANDGQRAVFYFSMRCAGLCGEGDLVFFEKENNSWKCIGHFSLWNN